MRRVPLWTYRTTGNVHITVRGRYIPPDPRDQRIVHVECGETYVMNGYTSMMAVVGADSCATRPTVSVATDTFNDTEVVFTNVVVDFGATVNITDATVRFEKSVVRMGIFGMLNLTTADSAAVFVNTEIVTSNELVTGAYSRKGVGPHDMNGIVMHRRY